MQYFIPLRRLSIKSTVVILLELALTLFSNSIHVHSAENADDFSNYYMDETCLNIPDPMESINRKIFYFNGALDFIILQPVARIYGRFTNDFVKDRVHYFIDNFAEPLTTVNYGVQAKPKKGLTSLWKFLINSTLGIGGLFDVAGKFGINVEKQNFGSTLAYYGVGTGPYIVLPFIGSSSIRDMFDPIVLEYRMNPAKADLKYGHKLSLFAIEMVDSRNTSLKITDKFGKMNTDPYVLVRNMYHQSREAQLQYPKGYNCNWSLYKNKKDKKKKTK